MNILVITRSAWIDENNTGNTMSNIFENFEQDKIYGLSLRSKASMNDMLQDNFSISEKQMIDFFRKKEMIGKESFKSPKADNNSIEDKMYTAAKKNNCMLLWFARELLWCISPWKNTNIDRYLDSIKPDIVFMPVFGCWYPHKVLKYVHKKTNAKVVLFHADDNYSMRQFSISPLYWIYRLNLRKWVRKSIKISDINYVISEIQKQEYAKTLKRDFKILFKGHQFNNMPKYENAKDKIIKLVFTGNISAYRYKSLASIGEALREINSDKKRAELDIYTMTPLNNTKKKALNVEGINLKGAVSADKVGDIQKAADILVHVESFSLRGRLAVHQSFSTKLVDYMSLAKCIFAVGPKDVASIDYLIKNDAAVVAVNKQQIASYLKRLIEDPNLIAEYGKKAWECGRKNHQIDVIQKNFRADLEMLLIK